MTLEEFINNTVIDEIGIMVSTPRLKYLSFIVMSAAIEFLGACLDNQSFHTSSRSQIRFEKAINEIPALSKYRGFLGKGSGINLYTELRCGLIHAALPQSGIELTEWADVVCGQKHMEIISLDNRSTNPRLILVCEDLYDDIHKAAGEVLQMLNSGKYVHKANAPFLATDINIAGTP